MGQVHYNDLGCHIVILVNRARKGSTEFACFHFTCMVNIFQKGGTLLHLYVEKPRVYTYILANHGVPVNVQDIVSMF